MHDELVMRERLEAFLADVEPRARQVSVSNYEPIAGGYSRVMARFELRWELDGAPQTASMVFRGDPPADRAGFHPDRRAEWSCWPGSTPATRSACRRCATSVMASGS